MGLFEGEECRLRVVADVAGVVLLVDAGLELHALAEILRVDRARQRVLAAVAPANRNAELGAVEPDLLREVFAQRDATLVGIADDVSRAPGRTGGVSTAM